MYQPIIKNTYTVEVVLNAAPSAGQKIKFVDIPQIRDVYTVGIQCFQRAQLTTSPSSLLVVTTIAGMTVTFAEQSSEDVFLYPCTDLNPALNSGITRMFKQKVLNFPKSYITINDATGLAVNQSVIFNILYYKFNELPKPK